MCVTSVDKVPPDNQKTTNEIPYLKVYSFGQKIGRNLRVHRQKKQNKENDTQTHTQEKQTFEKSVGNGERRIKANDVSQHLSRENKQTNRSSVVVVDIQQRDKEKEPMVKRKKKKTRLINS